MKCNSMRLLNISLAVVFLFALSGCAVVNVYNKNAEMESFYRFGFFPVTIKGNDKTVITYETMGVGATVTPRAGVIGFWSEKGVHVFDPNRCQVVIWASVADVEAMKKQLALKNNSIDKFCFQTERE